MKRHFGKTIRTLILAIALCLALTLASCGNTGEAGGDKPCCAIIAALEVEVELIRDELKDMKEGELLGTPTYEGMLGDTDIVVMQCGMGKVSAGIGTQALIDHYHPDYIINSGCAGALDKNLDVGDIVLSEKVVEWDLDLRAIGYPLGYIDSLGYVEMEASEELCDKIASHIPSGNNVTKGMVVSGDQFISTNEQRATILENFPEAKCAEMEGAAVGHVCIQNDIPFCIIRTMSDNANGDSGVDYATFSDDAGRNSASILIDMFKK